VLISNMVLGSMIVAVHALAYLGRDDNTRGGRKGVELDWRRGKDIPENHCYQYLPFYLDSTSTPHLFESYRCLLIWC